MESSIESVVGTLKEQAYKNELHDLKILELSGSTDAAMKRLAINIFCDNVTDEEVYADYKVLVGTSGATATGIDPKVVVVFRVGWPPWRSTLWQELGRLFRFGCDPSLPYLYHVTLNVGSYALLMVRTEMNGKATARE